MTSSNPMQVHNYVPPTHVSIGDLKFKGIFSKSKDSLRGPDDSTGCINSNCSDLTSAINRTIFDATYCSPWTPNDIIVLRIDILDEESNEWKTEYSVEEWVDKDLTSIFG